MDRTKLPRWAQSQLERLERDLASARAELRARATGETNTRVGDYTGEDWHLAEGARVIFTLPYLARDGRPAEVEARVEGDAVLVHTSGGGLIVAPRVSNSVAIGVQRVGE